MHLCSTTHYSADNDSFEQIGMITAFPFSNLRALAMERVRFKVPDLAKIFDACPNIVALAIDCWVDITTDETTDENTISASLRAGFGRLQSFAIWEEKELDSDRPSEISLISLAVSSFGSSLQALVCNMWAGNYADLFSPLASQCQNLVHLSLGSCYNALPLISCSPNLVQLRCFFDSEVADAVIKNCPHLRRVVMDAGVPHAVNYFIEARPPRTIEALRIEFMTDVHPVNWGGLLAYFGNNLKVLDVDCRLWEGLRREGVGMALMLGHSTGLRVLATDDESQEYDIWRLKQHCPSLEKIFVKSLHSKSFMEAARRKGVDVRPKSWRQECSVFIDPAKRGLD
ncbi:hypothetical protein HK104_010711 [Borealophlyctis nickersoniae]|nr:hypothetical protein HK104_010711 [Borealophlyctis nickersoniae]